LHLAGKNQQISLEGWMARKNISNKKCKIWRGLGLAWDCNICFLHSQMLCFICPRKGSDLSALTIFSPKLLYIRRFPSDFCRTKLLAVHNGAQVCNRRYMFCNV
jgi:hypothetical protein